MGLTSLSSLTFLLPTFSPPGNRNVFTLNFPMHISWNNGCTDKTLKCDLIKNLTPFCSAAEAEEEKKTKKKTREGNLRHEFVPLFAELFLGYFLWWCGLFWNKKTRRRRTKSFYISRIKQSEVWVDWAVWNSQIFLQKWCLKYIVSFHKICKIKNAYLNENLILKNT